MVEWAKKSSTKFRWIMLIFVIGTVLNVDTANRYLEHVYIQHYHAIANLAPAFQQQKELRQFMTDLGVNYHQEKPVIVIPDESPHFQLYKYNLRGFSFPPNEKMIAEVKLFVGFGCGPLIISDKRYLTEPLLQPFLTEPMGNFEEQIYVFKVNKSMVEEMEKSK